MNKRTILVLLISLAANACVHKSAPTSFYSLFPESSLTTSAGETQIRVGPIRLPEYMNTQSIITLTENNRIVMSANQVWGGKLDEAIVRVLVTELGARYSDFVFVDYLWKAQGTPDYQLQVDVLEYAGMRGGDVTLIANIQLIPIHHGQNIPSSAQQRVVLSENTKDASYEAYVMALNRLLVRLAKEEINLDESVQSTALANP